MYGLIQAAWQYYKNFINVMVTKLGFKKCLADSCLLKQSEDNGTLIICVYVDDILCICNQQAIDSLKVELAKYFAVKDEGKIEEYVGCLVMRNVVGNIMLHQPHLIKKI